jgi:hypothetical protein|tara:strand:- start:3714 stop:4574 length:861 start_codon:yes stop_codon:yes gene_type:complete
MAMIRQDDMIIHGLGDVSTLGWKYSIKSNICKKYKTWINANFTDLCFEDSYLPLSKTVWIEKLSKKLRCEFNLLAQEDNTNLDIFNSFVSNVNSFKSTDVVIINWTNNYKFNVYSHTEVHSISNVFDFENVSKLVQPDSVTDMFKNRAQTKSVYEVHTYERAIREICNNKNIQVFFWSMDNLHHLTHSDAILQRPEYILGKYLIKYRNECGIAPQGDFYNELDTPLFYSSINYIDGSMFMMSTDTNGAVMSSTLLGERGHDVLTKHFFSHFIKHIKNKKVTKNLLL